MYLYGASLMGKQQRTPPTSVGDMGSIPGSGRFRGEENGNTFQYSCLGNPHTHTHTHTIMVNKRISHLGKLIQENPPKY